MSETILTNPFEVQPEQPKKVIGNEVKMQNEEEQIDVVSTPPWQEETKSEPENTPPTVTQVEEIISDITSKSHTLPPNPKDSVVGSPVFNPSQQPNREPNTTPQLKQELLNSVGVQNYRPTQDLVNKTPPQTTSQSKTISSEPVFDNYTNDKNTIKYKIFDLYWLRNSKNCTLATTPSTEQPLLCISYNIDFDNLRFSFATPSNLTTIDQTSIELNSVNKLCTFNVYSEVCEELLILLNTPTGGTVRNFERLFKRNVNWSPPQAGFKLDQEGLHIIAAENNQTFTFTITKQWQLNTLKHSLDFMIKESRNLKISKFAPK